jgi:succinate dehydrogenase / fumarate reductase membrane anchor subunit
MTTEVTAAAATGTASTAPSETARARVQGHGSAAEGAGHWWQERVLSLATLLLWIWLGVSLLRLPGYDHAMISDWLSSPLAAVPMLLLVVATFWHARMGLQVIVDDYVHEDSSRLVWSVVLNFAAILAAAFAVFAILRLAFAGN